MVLIFGKLICCDFWVQLDCKSLAISSDSFSEMGQKSCVGERFGLEVGCSENGQKLTLNFSKIVLF